LRDFDPISVYLKSPFILVVDPALPVHSVAELIAYIKTTAIADGDQSLHRLGK
jgi:tripartite-type tricarboxylate transporter receptor subunit TctC